MNEKTNELIKEIGYHSVKKFELIESYVTIWCQKLLNYDDCK